MSTSLSKNEGTLFMSKQVFCREDKSSEVIQVSSLKNNSNGCSKDWSNRLISMDTLNGSSSMLKLLSLYVAQSVITQHGYKENLVLPSLWPSHSPEIQRERGQC